MRDNCFRIYLSGAVRNVSADESNEWRQKIWTYYSWIKDKIFIFNPDDFYNYKDKRPQTEKECMNHFLHHLRKSDLVIVNLDNSASSCGTLTELAIAYELKIPIIGFTVSGENIYNWAFEMCSTVFEHVDAEYVAKYVNEYYIRED